MRRNYARVGAASGAVCVVSVMVGNGLAIAGWSGATDGPGVLGRPPAGPVGRQHRRPEHGAPRLGALVMFLGYLYRVLQRAEGPDGWLAPVAFGSGLIMVCIKLGSVAPLTAGWYRRDDLTVITATTLSDLGGALFVVSGWATGLLVASAAGSALVSGVLPRWLGLVRDGQRRRHPCGRHRGDHGPAALHSAAIPGGTLVDPHHQRGPHRPGAPGAAARPHRTHCPHRCRGATMTE